MYFKIGSFVFIPIVCMIYKTQAQICAGKPDADKYCKSVFGNSDYAVCGEDGKCGCLDFFGIDNSRPTHFKCVKGVPAGKACSTNLECGIALGQNLGKCNASKKCECSTDTAGRQTKEVDGRCYRIKTIKDPCEDDKECILGSNEFARCVNMTCQCYESDIATFVLKDGKCVAEEKSNETNTSISTLAITISCSAVLFVIIAGIYFATNKSK